MKQSPSFLKLKAKWDKKLARSGFVDIEKEDFLKWSPAQAMTRTAMHQDRSLDESKQEYFRLAGHFLYDYKFPNKQDKFIWTQHCEGISIDTMFSLLKREGLRPVRDRIRKSIERSRHEMYKMYGVTRNGS
jgi:hypothetical protein